MTVGTTDGSLTTYRRSLDHLAAVAEERGPFKTFERTPERLVAAAWFDQQLDHANLKTVDGRTLEVLSPGRWDEGPGPDFREAQLRFSGRKNVTGDVEVEVFASDWDRHEHRSSADFGNVVLKVCMWNDIREPRKSAIPMIELFPHLLNTCAPDLESTRGYPFTSPTMRGRCTPVLENGPNDPVLSFIAAAGDERIRRKAERLGTLVRTFGVDQTLYKGIMEAMGYSANKEPMSRLADSIHLELIRSVIAKLPQRNQSDVILALFYGCSGFFDRIKDSDTPLHLAELKSIWREISSIRPLATIEGFRLAKVRPANSPWRRMAAVSSLLADVKGLKLFDYVLAVLGTVKERDVKSMKAVGKRLIEISTSLTNSFWMRRLSPLSDEGEKSYKLVGANLASIIVVNIVAPLVLAHANRTDDAALQQFVHQFLSSFGGQQHNEITRFTCARLFGPENIEPKFARNARLHQGLIQIYNDFCQSLRPGCPDCKLIEFLDTE